MLQVLLGPSLAYKLLPRLRGTDRVAAGDITVTLFEWDSESTAGDFEQMILDRAPSFHVLARKENLGSRSIVSQDLALDSLRAIARRLGTLPTRLPLAPPIAGFKLQRNFFPTWQSDATHALRSGPGAFQFGLSFPRAQLRVEPEGPVGHVWLAKDHKVFTYLTTRKSLEESELQRVLLNALPSDSISKVSSDGPKMRAFPAFEAAISSGTVEPLGLGFAVARVPLCRDSNAGLLMATLSPAGDAIDPQTRLAAILSQFRLADSRFASVCHRIQREAVTDFTAPSW
jgi:hypothetical protein